MKFVDHNKFDLNQYKISAAEYFLKIKERPKPIVLDIRLPEDYSAGTVEGAYSLPYNEFEERLIQLPPFSTIIIYSDQQDHKIAETTKLLWENGFTDLFYVAGGYDAIMSGLFEVSSEVLEKCRTFLKEHNQAAIRLDVAGYELAYELVADNLDLAKYKRVVIEGLVIYFLHRKLRLVEGTKIDWQANKPHFDHPRLHQPKPKESVSERVQKLLDRDINPMVTTHGGYVKLISVEDDIAYIEMLGGCQGCGMSAVTLKNGVEAAIFQNIPEISQVLDTTDHASGTNPYYQSTT